MTNIVYSTELRGVESKVEEDARVARELKEMQDMEFMFSEPWSYEEDDLDVDETLACGCYISCCTCEDFYEDGEFILTEEDIKAYDDNCEEYEERKRERLQLEQEY